jgi:hypothetical protein
MAQYSEMEDRIKRIRIVPEITRAFWSRRRAWHGDEVKLHVETRNVPDGAKVVFEIWEDDSGEANPDDFVTKLDDGYRIEGNRCTADYTIEWDEKTLGAEAALEGGEFEFYFLAKIESPALELRSALLYVDLADYLFSY